MKCSGLLWNVQPLMYSMRIGGEPCGRDYTPSGPQPYYEQCSLTTTTNHCRSHTLNRLQVIGHTLQQKIYLILVSFNWDSKVVNWMLEVGIAITPQQQDMFKLLAKLWKYFEIIRQQLLHFCGRTLRLRPMLHFNKNIPSATQQPHGASSFNAFRKAVGISPGPGGARYVPCLHI